MIVQYLSQCGAMKAQGTDLDPLFIYIFIYLCLIFIFVMLSCLFLAALWTPAGEGLTPCVLWFLCHFLSQVWYLIVSIPDLCRPLYF